MATMQEPRTRRDLEATIGVDFIEVLQADRRALIQEIAPLRARYGPGGTWDARRKAVRSARANEIAGELTRERGKAPSEAEVERLAAGDAFTLAQLDAAEEEMARYYLLEDRIQELTELIRRDDLLIRYAAFEPKV
jgi:hypothetical protein